MSDDERPLFMIDAGLPLELSVCGDCACLVADSLKHENWHRTVVQEWSDNGG